MKKRIIGYSIILLAFVLNTYYIKTAHLLLSPDEAYYWDWARHPALSYLDMGPMISWINMVMIHFFGSSEFALRMGANIFSTVTAIIFYEIGNRFFSPTTALTATALFIFNPFVASNAFIATYYVPQILFMTILIFLLFELNKNQKPWLWYLIGIVLGLGILSHHMFFFFSLEVVLFVLISNRNRHWLFKKEPYLGAVLTIITASPVFIWNFEHGFGMFKRALSLMPSHYNPWFVFSTFFFGDMGVLTPFVFLLVFYTMLYSIRKGLFRHDERFNVILATSLPTFLFITFLAFKGRAEVNWPAAGYIAPFIGGVSLLVDQYKKGYRKLIIAFLSLMFITTLLITYFEHYPEWVYKTFDIPPARHFSNRLAGWNQLAMQTKKYIKSGELVGATDYGITAELAFYLPGQPEVYFLKVNNSAKNAYLYFQNQKTLEGKNMIIVDRGTGQLNDVTQGLFKKVKRLGVINIVDNKTGDIRRSFTLYRGYDYTGK